MHEIDVLDATSFYGELASFQYPPLVARGMQLVLLAMCGYAEGYQRYRNKIAQATVSALVAGQLLLDAETRAQRIVAAFRLRNSAFVRAFWNLTDTTMLRHMPKVTSPLLAVNKLLLLPGHPLLLHNSFGPVLVVPGIVGKVGEFARKFQALDRSKIASLLKTLVWCIHVYLLF
jgi:hypothetical protein